jgi:peptide/nickel transport system substrate-binding protein
MNNIKTFYTLLFITVFVFFSCKSESPQNSERIIIGLSSDIETINPLYAFTNPEGNITELLFLNLVFHEWNDIKGELESFPMLAAGWQWNENYTSLKFSLRDDVYWSDGEPVTADDVVYSFVLYSDPEVQSKFFGTLDKFHLTDEGSIDIHKTFEVVNPYELIVKFLPGTEPTIFDVDFSILPKHIYEQIPRGSIATSDINFNPVTNGPYKLERWIKNQNIVLTKNESSFLTNSKSVPELIFKIIPDYHSRVTQLKNKQIDILEELNPDDIASLNSLDFLKIDAIKGRDFDYIGWNNIDPLIYNRDKIIKSHSLFGNKNIRKALTYAINRQEIVDEYLQGFGEVANGPVSSIFTGAFDKEINPLSYNPEKAKELLALEGWNSYGPDGILRKGNDRFSYILYFPGGNPLRSYTATVIRNNLKEIGVELIAESLEPGVFFEKMFSRQFDAWLAGWSIPIPLDLKQFWHSDLERTMLNVAGFQNTHADILLDSLQKNIIGEKKNILFKKLQQIFLLEQPVTFLFWIDKLVAYNKDIKNISANPYGLVHHCWKWYKEE